MNKKGATLLELIVYVSLFAIVSVFIGSQVNSIVKNFTGGTRTSLLQATGRDALAVMARKIRNTGFKSYMAGTTLIKDPGAIYSDSSSFIAAEGTPGDTLTTLQVSIDREGRFVSVDTTRIFLDGTKLCIRNGGKTSVLSGDVYGLQFQYGVFGADSVLIKEDPVSNSNWSLSGCAWGTGAGVIITNSNTAATIECQKSFTMANPCRVSIKFRVEPSGGTSPADTLKWNIKTVSSGTLSGTASFKPATLDNEIIIPLPSFALSKLSLSFTKVRPGSLKISYVYLRIIDKGVYTWTNKPSTAQKRFVRAVRISMLSRSGKKTNSSEGTPITIGNATIQRNGPYSWRLNTEVVEIPNNGLF